MGLTARIRTRDGWAVSHAVVTVTDTTGAQVLRAETDAEGAVHDTTSTAHMAATAARDATPRLPRLSPPMNPTNAPVRRISPRTPPAPPHSHEKEFP